MPKETQTKESRQNNSENYKKYDLFLQFLFHEGQMAWQNFGIFLVAHTILTAEILRQLIEPSKQQNERIMLISLIGGLFITILWWISYTRRSLYYEFRTAQAKSIEPKGWNLLSGDGENFSKGNIINIKNKEYCLDCLNRCIFKKSRYINYSFIILFFLFYLINLFNFFHPLF